MMKRISSILLALLLSTAVLASCGKSNETKETNAAETNAPETSVTETAAPETTAPAGETAALDAQTALSNIFVPFLNKMAPAFGVENGEEIAGYFCGATETVTETDPESGEEYSYDMPVEGPGVVDLSNIEAAPFFTYTLLPADKVADVASASVFFNMMNQNNATISAFEVKDPANVQALADTMKETINGNMWMCGFPERYLIVNVNGTLISVFGLTDVTNAMKDAIAETYADAVVIYDAALGE